MFAGTVFLSQYFQLARGESPTMSGLMTIPMIGGLFVSSTVTGRIITRTGTVEGASWSPAALLVTAGCAPARHDPRRHPVLADRASTWRCWASASA